jgi:tetratricopeptide (TPR) repeat protein
MKTTNGHYDEAIELFQDMLSIYGSDPGIIRSLAYIYYLKGEYVQSEKYYRQVLSGDTLNLDYLQILGNIAGIKGEYARAKSYYTRVISLDSTYVDAYLKLAELETIAGDLLPAKTDLEKAEKQTESSQDQAEIYSGLGIIYQKLGETKSASENFNQALLYARRFVMEFPDNPIAYLRLGESFFNIGAVDSAINFYHMAEFLENKPLYRGKVFLALGKAYQGKNNRSKAMDYFQEVLNIPSGFEEKTKAQEFLAEDTKSHPKN